MFSPRYGHLGLSANSVKLIVFRRFLNLNAATDREILAFAREFGAAAFTATD